MCHQQMRRTPASSLYTGVMSPAAHPFDVEQAPRLRRSMQRRVTVDENRTVIWQLNPRSVYTF
jgi:hypothetical protein